MTVPPTPAPPAATGISTEISNAIASVWAGYAAGGRPTGVRTEIRDNVVKCILPDAVKSFEDGMAAAAAEEEETPGARPRTPNTYKRDANAAVRRLTHRKVSAFISKHDAKTDVATELFILDPVRR